MKIKRFIAPDMRTALHQVRQEHGPDAVILSNRMTDDGIEIVAASHYEQDDALQTLTEGTPEEADDNRNISNITPFPATATISSTAASQQHPTNTTQAAPSPVSTLPPRSPALTAADAGHSELRAELAQMRQMIERQMQHLSDERLRSCGVRQQIMQEMEDRGFDAAIIRDVAHHIPADAVLQQARGQMFELLSQRLPICPDDPLDQGGVIAIIGPAGAGKTTTIAKLAARYSTRHSTRDIALVSTDATRPGSSDALSQYARRLGIAIHEVDAGADLNPLLQRLKGYPLILLDTPGLARGDHAVDEHIAWLRAAHQIRPFLVLPATTQPADLDEVVCRFHSVRPEAIILSKLDETCRPGGALSVVMSQQLPLVWVTDGQRLHDDLHHASAASLLQRLDKQHASELDAAFIPAFTAPGDNHMVAGIQ